jgi:hypothetical protein
MLAAQRAYVQVAALKGGVDGPEVPTSPVEVYRALHAVYHPADCPHSPIGYVGHQAQKAALAKNTDAMEAQTRRPRIGILGSTRGTNTLHIYAEIAAGRLRSEVAVASGGEVICGPRPIYAIND